MRLSIGARVTWRRATPIRPLSVWSRGLKKCAATDGLAAESRGEVERRFSKIFNVLIAQWNRSDPRNLAGVSCFVGRSLPKGGCSAADGPRMGKSSPWPIFPRRGKFYLLTMVCVDRTPARGISGSAGVVRAMHEPSIDSVRSNFGVCRDARSCALAGAVERCARGDERSFGSRRVSLHTSVWQRGNDHALQS